MREEDSTESEKRFQSVMDKLFNTPKRNPSSRNQSSKSKKRASSALSESNESRGSNGLSRSLVPAESFLSSSSAPMCRPWDRGDFFRRLATFKSMTWFAKPKVISAINCARRGWINVEMDIIACEACGARLLFSSPSSWAHQQIEKAAAVFSLKLDNGHKLLCPWIDNASDESIALFPPSTALALVDSYRKRLAALLQLSALPKISSSAIGYMRCPQLECFLEHSSAYFGIESTNTSIIEDLGSERATSAKLYYQAQKLISLCGWEPRSLPYAVDCKDLSTKAAKNSHSEEMSHCLENVQKSGVMYLTSGVEDVMDVEDPSFNVLQSDPACTVLDCKLCGASAGLWAFTTVPRPLELFRIDASFKVNGQTYSGNSDANVNGCIPGAPTDERSGKYNHVNSNTTTMEIATATKELLYSSIARGPPPAKQNYRATVSLPIITRHLRVVLSKANSKDTFMSSCISRVHKTTQCNIVDSQDNDHATPDKSILQSEDMETSAQNKNGDEVTMFNGCSTSYLNGDYPPKNDDENAAEGSEKLIQSPSRNVDYAQITNETSSHGKELICIAPDANGSDKSPNPNGMSMPEVSVHQLDEVPSDTNMILGSLCTMNLQKDDFGGISGTLEGVNKMQHIVSNEEETIERTAAPDIVTHLERVQSDRKLEFDPIRQHRHFCPWVLSMGKAGPGWQQTLYALARDKSSPHSPLSDSASPSKFEDDPVSSIRNLFQSPLTKRLKKS